MSRPLYDTGADQQLFVAPTEWEILRRALARQNNVLIAGARGSGKTSLLRQCQYALRQDGSAAVFVDANAVETPLELAMQVREALTGRPGAGESLRAGLATAAVVVGGDPAPPPSGTSRAMFGELEAIAGAAEAFVLIDASGAAAAAHGLFGRMRDAIWHTPHHWVVAVDSDEKLAVLHPPADAFFDTVLDLSGLTTDSLIELLRRREASHELDPATVRQVAESADGNPRRALRTANQTVVLGSKPRDALFERGRLLDAASTLGRPHGMLMAELLDLGQASSSDEVLQQRLGLTRGRLTALLRELLDANLVEAASDRSQAPGRPKTIYRPRIKMGTQ